MKTVIEMAREAGFSTAHTLGWPECYARFAELVTEQANARANASWTLMCKKMVAAEREACAKVCENEWGTLAEKEAGLLYAAEIRARSKT